MRPMSTRRPTSWQRSGSQDAHPRIVAKLLTQRGTGFLRASVVEHDDVQMSDATLAQRSAHCGDRGIGVMPHWDEYRHGLVHLGRPW